MKKNTNTGQERMISLLHVDDDPMVLWAFKRLFRKNAYMVLPATNAPEAISWVKRYPFDLAILDISMPFLDGFALLEELRQYHPGLPVVFLTGHQESELTRKAYAMGCEAVIEKAVHPAELKAQIQEALQEVIEKKRHLAATES